jgi:hypothetical protein
MDIINLPIELLAKHDIDPRWLAGPFANLKALPAKGKGKRFEQIAQAILENRGHIVSRAINKDHDRIVDGCKSEIKGSTITKGSDDCFSFLQIRPSQDYEHMILETFWFDGKIKFYRMDKASVLALVAQKVFVPQHGGKVGNSGTFSYNGNLDPFLPYFWFEVQVV